MDLVPGWDRLETYHERMQTICSLFVHPNDRASFMHETDLAVLRDTLTKEASCKFVNFRKLFGDSIVYYQGKNVLLNHEGANVPIVAMTANAFEEDCQLALEAGMNEHVAKPIDVPKLLKTPFGDPLIQFTFYG